MAAFFIRIITAILTALMAFNLPVTKAQAPADTSDFVPVVRFAVMSDTHIETVSDVRSKRIQSAITMAYSDAEADPVYKLLDAVMFSGDLADNGTKWQFCSYASAVNSVIKDDTQLLAVLAQSHDCKGSMGKGSIAYLQSLLGTGGDWHVVINGFHFIGVSTCEDDASARYSQAQHDWVAEQLALAAADDPSKPIFFTHHEHPYNTVYGSSAGEWGESFFCDLFEQYPQLIHFSGHSHYPLNDPRSIWQGKYTAVGTGAITYMEFTVDNDHPVHPDNYRDCGQFWIVEVDAGNNVRLRGYDVTGKELLCEYVLGNVSDSSARQYTPAQQKAKSTAPVFAEGAQLKVKMSAGSYTVTAPAAISTDGNIVFLYRYSVKDSSGTETDSGYIVNTYWLGTRDYSSVEFSVSAAKGSTISFTAENAYGMKTDALTYTVE